MPINYSFYPANWDTEIRPYILHRAHYCCEKCFINNGAVGYRDKKGIFYTIEMIDDCLNSKGYDYFEHELVHLNNEESEGKGFKFPIKIILTIAHLDNNVKNNDHSNLAALCQRCHLNHDRRDNIYRRKLGKNYKESLLFDKATFDKLKVKDD